MSAGNKEGKPAANGRTKNQEILGTNSEIGRKLKQYYDGLVSEEVPDRFSELLSQLEEREKTASYQGKD